MVQAVEVEEQQALRRAKPWAKLRGRVRTGEVDEVGDWSLVSKHIDLVPCVCVLGARSALPSCRAVGDRGPRL